MDMIRSGLDACPWGLTGYGFDEYIVGSPGNAVLALARYWLDNATLIHEVEKEHSQRCHRIRYEDLVQDPEETMREVYAFVGVQSAPGVVRACSAATGSASAQPTTRSGRRRRSAVTRSVEGIGPRWTDTAADLRSD